MKLIVYDFDGTIYDGDSTMDFLLFLIKKKKKLIFYIPNFVYSFIKYKLKLIKKEKLKETFFSVFQKFDNIDILVKDFWLIHENKIKTFFRDKKNHTNDIIATASPEFLIEPMAKKYKVKKLFGSKVNKETGKYVGLNCHGAEKIKRIYEIYPECVIKEMYSDDIVADKPLLDLAESSYVIKKNDIISYTKYEKNNKLKILYNKYKEIINYLIVGGLTVIISLLTYYICVYTFLDPYNSFQLQIANIISWIVSVVFAYFANRIFVFESKNPNKLKEAASFIGTRISTLILDMLVMFVFVSLLLFNDKIAKIISQILVIICNYLISKFFVFKKQLTNK